MNQIHSFFLFLETCLWVTAFLWLPNLLKQVIPYGCMPFAFGNEGHGDTFIGNNTVQNDHGDLWNLDEFKIC